MDNTFQKLGGTKWLFALLVLAIASVLAWFGKIDGTRYCELIGAVAGLYFAGNVGATFANAKMEQAKKQ